MGGDPAMNVPAAPRTRPRTPAALLFALALAALAAGCRESDPTTFYHGTNYEAKAAVTATLDAFRDGVNARDADRAMSAWPDAFRFPDESDPALVHTHETMRTGWRSFFARADRVSFGYDDLFLRIDESNAYADVKILRSYRGHAPFVHAVDDAGYERLYFARGDDGAWRFATAPHRMRPPEILDR